MVEVWLSNAEKQDSSIQAKLKPLFTAFKQKKYMVTVFQSGSQELYTSVRDLLIYNKRRCAQLAMLKDKKQCPVELTR